MKKRWAPAVTVVLILLSSLAFGGDLPCETHLPFKEVTIHYELKGSEKGVETLYIRDYGKVRAEHHKASTTIMGMT
jgi:hypothetical protein